MNLYENIKDSINESDDLGRIENLGEISTNKLANLDWPDGNVAIYKIDNLNVDDILEIAKLLNKTDSIFKYKDNIVLYCKEVNGLGGRHFSDFKDSVLKDEYSDSSTNEDRAYRRMMASTHGRGYSGSDSHWDGNFYGI